MMGVRLREAGVGGLLVEVANEGAATALFRTLERAGWEGVFELIPGERTVLIRYDPLVLPHTQLMARLRTLTPQTEETESGDLVVVPVRYDGPDLEAVATLTGLSVAEVIQRHTAATYRVSFTGFAPGFAYLTGGDPALSVRRRLTPRATVPAGAVGLAGAYSGIYPRTSPGGWQLIGTALTDMWDEHREPPALLRPGMRVQFAVAEQSVSPIPTSGARTTAEVPDLHAEGGSGLQVDIPGVRLTLQDEGRALQARYGVTQSGAMDPGALHTANWVVGNSRAAVCLESWGGNLQLHARGPQTVAVFGGNPEVTITRATGREVSFLAGEPIPLQDGDQLGIGALSGVYTYVAVRGGFVGTSVLGSCSTDTLSGLGPAPVKPAQLLTVGPSPSRAVQPVFLPSEAPTASPQSPVILDAIAGPRDDWFTPDGVRVFWNQVWTVSPVSDRVGIRLKGADSPQWKQPGELASEGMVRGAIEVPADGDPVALMADHPVTGGYPVIACLTPTAQALLAQAPAGTSVQFRRVEGDREDEVAALNPPTRTEGKK